MLAYALLLALSADANGEPPLGYFAACVVLVAAFLTHLGAPPLHPPCARDASARHSDARA